MLEKNILRKWYKPKLPTKYNTFDINNENVQFGKCINQTNDSLNDLELYLLNHLISLNIRLNPSSKSPSYLQIFSQK